jgi:hypothetical protein
MSCTRAISKIFSNALTTFRSVVLNWGPYTLQNVPREAGNESIFPHTNLLDTLPILHVRFLPLFRQYHSNDLLKGQYSSISRLVEGPAMVNMRSRIYI